MCVITIYYYGQLGINLQKTVSVKTTRLAKL